jgi:predicted regulator of Ras-like GTPase activity (Roadblock/LC7/MglB family)
MQLHIEKTPGAGGWEVHMLVVLDRRETNELFLAGDALVSWPTDGMRPTGRGPIDRSSMFLSEIVGRAEGLRLAYETEELAERAGDILEIQVRSALERWSTVSGADAVRGATDVAAEDPIHEIISGYLEISGVMAAILVSDQGLVVSGAMGDPFDIDIDTISALVVETVASARRVGAEAAVGKIETMILEFEKLSVLLAPFDNELMLALVGKPGTFAQSVGLPAV